MKYDLRVQSNGGGRQSIPMYVMNILGELGPRLDASIFADVGNEPQHVLDQIDWLKKTFNNEIPIITVSKGDLAEDWFNGQKSRVREENAMGAVMPWHLDMPGDAPKGFASRTCTQRLKIEPIREKIRDLLGLKPGDRVSGRFKVEMWLGISLNEAHRMRDSTVDWITNRYPFVYDRPMRTGEILNWMKQNGYPEEIKRSACWHCPFRSDREWLDLKNNAPDSWNKAVAFDKRIRAEKRFVSSKADPEKAHLRGVPYLHASLKPLDEVEFDENKNQTNLFGNDCSGHCGV